MQSTLTPELALRSAVSTPRPVWPKLPTAEAFFPLVVLITTILPGLFAWYFGELTPRMSLWGLWGLHLLHGFEGLPAEFPDTLPPLYAWFNAVALSIPFPERLWAPMLPAYVFALISLGSVFWLGRLWYGPGTGLLTCFFLGLNPLFLGAIQNGESATAKLAFAVIGLLCYAQHLRSKAEALSPWIIPGGIAFGGLLLTAGWYALALPLIGALHIHLHEAQQRDDLPTTIRQSIVRPTMLGGLLVILVGVLLAIPWLWSGDWPTPGVELLVPEAVPGLSLAVLVRAMPGLTMLGLYGFWCSIHETLRGGREGSQAALPVVWICVAVLALRLVPTGTASLLFLAVPILFLAVRTLFELLQRQIRDSRVLALMLCSSVLFVYSRSTALQALPGWLADFSSVSAQDKLRLHFGVDALIIVVTLLALLYRLTAQRDFYRRLFFASFVILVILHGGVSALVFNTARVRRTDPWLEMYRVLKTQGPYDQIIIVGSEPPQPALLYATRVLYPAVAHHQTPSASELDKLLAVIDGNPLVVVIDPSQKLLHRTRFVVGDKTIILSPVYDGEQLTAYAPDKT